MNSKIELLQAMLDQIETEIYEAKRELEELGIDKPIKGSIVFKTIKCGKPGCRCVVRGELHGPYPHLQWWENGKIKTKYINKKQYESFTKMVDQSRRYKALVRLLGQLEQRQKRIIRELQSDS